MAVRIVICMSFYRKNPLWSIVSKLRLALPGKKELVAPCAIVQARQRLGADAVKQVLSKVSKCGMLMLTTHMVWTITPGR